MLHWNGRSWSKATVPNPNVNTAGVDNELAAGTCSSTRNCWAVGQQDIFSSVGRKKNEALHWNGKHWSLVSTPNPGGTTMNRQQQSARGALHVRLQLLGGRQDLQGRRGPAGDPVLERQGSGSVVLTRTAVSGR